MGPPATRRRDASWQLDDFEAWIVLACGAAFAVALILLEGRPNTFFNDEIAVFQRLGEGIDARSILEPHNGHLILPAHLVYAAVFSWVGPSYTVFRIIGVIVLLACGVLFYLLARRRVGATIALVPAILLLLLGSAWEALLWPLTMLTFGLAVAFGLAALVALDRGGRRGDVLVCGLTALAVVSHSTGLAFLVGVAVAVLASGRGRQRAWVFAVPLAIYAAWWIWALQFHEGLVHFGNLLIVPVFMANSLAGVAAAVTGLGLDLGSAPVSLTVTPSWGYVIAPIAGAALAVRLLRGRIPRFVWIAIAILLAFWLELALGYAPEGRTPFESRYLFPGAVLVLLAAVAALEGVRIVRAATIAIVTVGVVGVLTNIKQLDNAEKFFGDYSPRARTALGAIEIARGSVSPDYRPQLEGLGDAVPQHFPVEAGPYLEAVDRFGSFAFSSSDLLRQDVALRDAADQVLGSAEGLSLRPVSGVAAATGCTQTSGGESATRVLPFGEIQLSSTQPARVRLGRFGAGYPVDLGALTPGVPARVSIPRDEEARPWRIEVKGGGRVRMCAS